MTQDEELSSTEGPIATIQDVEAAIEKLTSADRLRLRYVSQYWLWVLSYYGGGQETVDDLLQSAIVKVLDGTRQWNKDKVDFVGLLTGIIQSNASHALERYVRGGAYMEPITESELAQVTEEGDDCNPLDRIPSDSKTPEVELIERESRQEDADLVGRVLTMFQDDGQASEVLLHRLDGLNGPEIQKRMGLSKKEYATIDQRIRRGFSKLSGAGGKYEH